MSYIRRTLWILVVVMLGVLVGGLWSNGIASSQRTAAGQPRIQKLEYRMAHAASEGDLANQANSLGEQGWELTSVVRDATGDSEVFGYFKRPKP